MNSQTTRERKGALVVGARSRRQGTGPFIAAGLASAGLPVTGIVGTAMASVNEAAVALATAHGIAAEGYTDLERALEELTPLAVAICTPWQFHEAQLASVAEAGCHCLVEKPLAWPASRQRVTELVTLFERQGLLLQVVNQWPTTLAAFETLHGALPATVERFSMRLSPISIGPDMVTDSAPHFLGMLDALCGPGRCEDVRLRRDDTERAMPSLRLDCRYEHARGSCGATLFLRTQQRRPRPAWYQVNELRVDREVELPHYRQYLVGETGRTALEDPMALVAGQFAGDLAVGRATERERLLSLHDNLLRLAAAWD